MTIIDIRPVFDIRPINFVQQKTAETAGAYGTKYIAACSIGDLERAAEMRFGDDASCSDYFRVLSDAIDLLIYDN